MFSKSSTGHASKAPRSYKFCENSSDAPHVREVQEADRASWDHYVSTRPDACHYHQFAWRSVIHGAYGHGTHYLVATCGEHGRIAGVLPLVHLRSRIFGGSLVSLPFADTAGILADGVHEAEALVSAAVDLARQEGARSVDLRFEQRSAACEAAPGATRRADKVRMLLALPESSAELRKSFRSKLRSQINRPLRDGCTCRVGGLELLEDFYRVFLVNMRDLGSPVHSKELMRHVLEVFPEQSRIFVVDHAGTAIAASLVFGFNRTLRNPWASSDRRYAAMSPNMLLYARMLEYACDQGYRTFDFGRSTLGEGTYRFKQQWGALASPLYWYVLSTDGTRSESPGSVAERFGVAARLWSKLPLAVTRVLGPRIRKHISL